MIEYIIWRFCACFQGGHHTMAADGGFSTKPMGFDKNEVNEYISSLRKRMNEIEAEKKENDKKTQEAIKTAEEADERVKQAEEAGEKKAAALQEQLDVANVKAERANKQVEDLKKQLSDEKQKMTDMLKSGKGVSAEAKKAYNEALARAEEDAKEITDKAQETAAQIIADAEARRTAADEKLAKLMELVRAQMEIFNGGYKSISDAAADLLGTELAPAAVEIPDFSAMVKPAAPESKPEAPEKPAKPENPAKDEKTAKQPEPVQEKQPEPVEASFDAWGGSDLAASILEDEKKAAAADTPADDPFANDLFGMAGGDDVGADLTGAFEAPVENPVDEVLPLDNSDHAKPVTDITFAEDLISQTMTSSNLDGSENEDLLAAVKAQEEKFAVQPNVPVDLDMDDMAEDSPSDEDIMAQLLKEAEALGQGSFSEPAADIQAEEEKPVETNPWDDLQKQLEAMEQSGFGGLDLGDAPEPKAEDPKPVSADDSSIWDFGSGESSDNNSDDDMSGDMFGGFGF